jgi:very-short-patch-repair endonuclease
MLEIEKLSEKSLYDVLCFIFKNDSHLIQKQKKLVDVSNYYLVDYYFENNDIKVAFEFDGPTHFTQSKTQLRDIRLQNFCDENNIYLIRFPYFIQIDDRTLSYYLTDYIWDNYLESNEKYLDIKSIYKNGFWDKKIVYPGDFNAFGWKLFHDLYLDFIKNERWSIDKEIYDSLSEISVYLAVGIDYDWNEEKQLFIQHYPT